LVRNLDQAQRAGRLDEVVGWHRQQAAVQGSRVQDPRLALQILAKRQGRAALLDPLQSAPAGQPPVGLNPVCRFRHTSRPGRIRVVVRVVLVDHSAQLAHGKMGVLAVQRVKNPGHQADATLDGKLVLRQLEPVADPPPAIVLLYHHQLRIELQVSHCRAAGVSGGRPQRRHRAANHLLAVQRPQHQPAVGGDGQQPVRLDDELRAARPDPAL